MKNQKNKNKRKKKQMKKKKNCFKNLVFLKNLNMFLKKDLLDFNNIFLKLTSGNRKAKSLKKLLLKRWRIGGKKLLMITMNRKNQILKINIFRKNNSNSQKKINKNNHN